MPVKCRSNWVENAPLREAFERSGLTPVELASLLGVDRVYRTRLKLADGTERTYEYRSGDGRAVRRALGFCGYRGWGERRPPQRYMKQETALRYAEVLGLDPVDIGL